MGVPGLIPALKTELGHFDVRTFPLQCDAIVVDCNPIFHQCLTPESTHFKPYERRVLTTLFFKLKSVLWLLSQPCSVFFCMDGVSGTVKLPLQYSRRKGGHPFKKHLAPCTVMMHLLERVIHRVALSLQLPEAYLSSSFVVGEGEHKAFFLTSGFPALRNILLVSPDNDLISLSLLRIEDYDNIYICGRQKSVLHINGLAQLLVSRRIDIVLFVFTLCCFGNDYCKPVCLLTENNLRRLLSFLENKRLVLAGLLLHKTMGSHTWRDFGISRAVCLVSADAYNQFLTTLFLAVHIKRTYNEPIRYSQYFWTLKYYTGDPDTNLNQMNEAISDASRNTMALDVIRHHAFMGTLNLWLPHVVTLNYFEKIL